MWPTIRLIALKLRPRRTRGFPTHQFPKYQRVATHHFPKYWRVRTHRFPKCRGTQLWMSKTCDSPVIRKVASCFTVRVNLQAHATIPLKHHSFKKLSNSNVKYTNTFDLCLNKFPSPRFFGRLPGFQSTGESFLKSNNSMKNWEKSKQPKDISYGTKMSWLMKKCSKKSRESVTLRRVADLQWFNNWLLIVAYTGEFYLSSNISPVMNKI